MINKRFVVVFASILLIPGLAIASDHHTWNDLVRPLEGSAKILDIIVTVRPSVDDEKLKRLHQAASGCRQTL